MHAIIGLDANSSPVTWDPEQTINPHMIVTGVSGSGKTHFLRSLIHQLCSTATKHVRCHLIDVHEDIEIPGASSLKFSSNMPYGFNPLIIDPDPDFGGPQKAVSAFIDLLGKTANYKLGDRQIACIQNLLMDLYAQRGFYQDNVNSWRLDDGYTNRREPKRFPTLKDAYIFAKKMHETMFVGISTEAMAALRDALYKQRSLMRAKKKANADALKTDESKEVVKAIEKFSSAMKNYIDLLHGSDGNELEKLMKYPSEELLSGVVDRLGKLHFMGIFSGEAPPFDPNATVWRYCLKSLERDESIMFVNVLAKTIFNNAKARGITESPREFIFVDEARRFQDPNGSIFDVISAESRKFGLGLISASQAHSHFTENAIQAAATQVILHQDASVYSKVKNLTGASIDSLASIKPRSDALVRITLKPSKSQSSRNLNYERVLVNTSQIANKLGLTEAHLSPPVSFKSYESSAVASRNFAPRPRQQPEPSVHRQQSVNRPSVSSASSMPSSERAVSDRAPAMSPPGSVSDNPFSLPAHQQPSAEVDIPDITDEIDVLAEIQHGAAPNRHEPSPFPAKATDLPYNVESGGVAAGDDKADSLISSHFNFDDDEPVSQSANIFGDNPNDPLSLTSSIPKPKSALSAADVLAKVKRMGLERNASTTAAQPHTPNTQSAPVAYPKADTVKGGDDNGDDGSEVVDITLLL